jgi:hypothetical protein
VPKLAVNVAEVSAQKVNASNEDIVAVGFETAIEIVAVELDVPAVAEQV